MNFEYLFAAIELFDNGQPSLKSVLFDARRRLRYANPPSAAVSVAELRGIQLLDIGNFSELSSGWLESGEIFFPVGRHPKTRSDILERLRWMLDCRLNATAGDYLWEPVREALPSQYTGLRNDLSRCSLPQLADELTYLRAAKPQLFDLLMAGRLGEAKARLGNDIEVNAKAVWLTRMMSILWMLFDLQIIAYRLFVSEHRPLNQPLIQAQSMTLGAFEKHIKLIQAMALDCKTAFDGGLDGRQLPRKLNAFLRKSNLWAIAARQLSKASARQPDQAAVFAEVKRMLDRAATWTRRLERMWNSRRTAFGFTFKMQHKSTFEIDLAPMPQAKAADAGRSSTAIQFGAPAVTLLLFAVTEAVEDLSRQPANIRPERFDRLKVGGRRSLLDQKTSQRLITALFTAYRDLYARPTNAQRASVDKEAHTAKNHAIKAQQLGSPDIGLEPMPANARDYPIKPFYFGMSAEKLIAPGVGDDPGVPHSPADYIANRIDAATHGKVSALRNRLSSSPLALQRIDALHIQFKPPLARK